MKNYSLVILVFLFISQVRASEDDIPRENREEETVYDISNDPIVLLRVGDLRFELSNENLNSLPKDCPLRVMFQSEIPAAKKDDEGYFIIQEEPELFEQIVSWLIEGQFDISGVRQAMRLRSLADRWVPIMVPVIDRFICLQTKSYTVEFRKLDSSTDSYFICRENDGLVLGLEDSHCCNHEMMKSAEFAHRVSSSKQLRNYILMAIPCGQHFSYSYELDKCKSRIFNLLTRKPIGDTCSFAQALSLVNSAVPPYIAAPVCDGFAVFNMVDGEMLSQKLFKDPTSCLLYIYKHHLKSINLEEFE